ncbi:MAG: XRE family transcriptional regulator, partial [Clostridia bacterium]
KSQTQIANEIGISQRCYSNYENGKTQPDYETLGKLASYFAVSVDYLLGRASEPNANNLPSNCGELGDFIMYPVIGSIRAGFDGLAEEYPTGECVIITVDMLHGRDKSDFFVLTVKGDSMYPKFLSGDRILVKKCSSVDSGDIAAVLYNSDEATVKKVEYPIRKDENWLDLVPLNPEYKTKRIQGADLELCRVIGKVEYLVSRKI